MHHQLSRNELCGIDAHGEAKPLGGQNDRRIDADNLASKNDQRPAGVARIQRSIRLDDVIDQPAGFGT